MADTRLAGPIVEVPREDALAGFRGIAVVEGKAVHADKDTAAHRGKVRGVSAAAATGDDDARVQILGPMVNPSWAWTADLPIYLGSDGALTQTRPTTGFVQIIGWADTATQIDIRLGEPKDIEERHVHKQESFTLNSTDIANKYVLLALEPVSSTGVQLVVEGAGGMRQATDFQMDGSNRKKLTWDGLALDGLLSDGDKLTVHYYREPFAS